MKTNWLIEWIEIYPLDSAIHLLNIWGNASRMQFSLWEGSLFGETVKKSLGEEGEKKTHRKKQHFGPR